MALTVDTTIAGLEVNGAYVRIDALRFDHPSRVYMGVNTYADKEQAGHINFKVKDISLSVEAFGGKDNINLCKAYEILKGMEEFAGAEDN